MMMIKTEKKSNFNTLSVAVGNHCNKNGRQCLSMRLLLLLLTHMQM